MSPAGLVCFGNAVYDTIVRPVEAIRWDATTYVDAIEQSVGGNGAITSYAARLMGVPARLLTWIGQDADGDYAYAFLRDSGVDLRFAVRTGARTARTVSLVNPSASRSFLHRPGISVEAFRDPVAFTPGLVEGCSHFHLANPFALPNMRRTGTENLKRAKECGLRTSVDTGWDSQGEWMQVIGPCLPFTDILFANLEEAQHLTGEQDVASAARVFLDAGVRIVAIKLGRAGCACFGEVECRETGYRVEAIDSTGAGDAFAGAFLAALQRGADVREAARVANAVGALGCTALGGVAGLRNWEETRRWMEAQ